MERSLVGATHDLLTFDGRGTFAQFDRCFRKASRYFEFDPDERTRVKLRNVAFRYLRTTGFLDVSSEGRSSSWSTAPANIVQRGEGEFVLVGDSVTARAIVSATPADQLSWHASSDGNLVDNRFKFFPAILGVRAQLAEMKALCERTGVSLETSYQRKCFRFLPGIDSVRRQAVAIDPVSAGFEPSSTDEFDFARCEWLPFRDPRPTHAGLFRQRFDYAQPRYFIAVSSRASGLTTFRVLQPDWTLIAALSLLNRALPARYERRHLRLLVSRRYHSALRLPTLVERCLRSGTLLNPNVSRESFAYEGLTPTSVGHLARKLPVITIEERQ